MQIARVIGDIVTARKHGRPRARKVVLVQPLNLDSTNKGQAVVALDTVDARVGDCVLLVAESFSAQLAAGRPDSPIDMAVVGKVDRIDLFPDAPGMENK